MIIDSFPNKVDLKTPLIVAVSGGPDSVALLDLLYQAGFKKLIVSHVDHQLRSTSRHDAALVKKLANGYGYRFALKKVAVQKIATRKKENVEAVGRDERYAFFRVMRKKYRATSIVTAHHADDQLETVLLNIVRGCGFDGLSGMQAVDGELWRPLLAFSKKDLLAYARRKKLPFIRDASNDDTHRSRNLLRKKIIPQLKKLNPQLHKTMSGNVELWRKARDYFQERAADFLKTQQLSPRRYDLKIFLALPEFEQQNTLRALFEKIHGHKKDLQQAHIDQLLEILRKPVSGKKKEFGLGKFLWKGRGWFEIREIY